MNELTIEGIASQMEDCKSSTWNEIKAIHAKLAEGDERMSSIEKSLGDADLYRVKSSTEIKGILENIDYKLEQHSVRFNNHEQEEMSQSKVMSKAIEDLTKVLNETRDETDENSEAIKSRNQEEMVKRIKKEAIEEHNAPYKEVKKKIILTATAIITGAVLAGVWKLIMLLSYLDNTMKGVQ